MNDGRIGLVMAMPDELRPLLACVGRVRSKERDGTTILSFRIGRWEVYAVESGMGILNATKASRMLVEQCEPGLLLNAGFGGSITGKAAVGDIVIADNILLYENNLFHETECGDTSLPAQAVALLGESSIRFRVLRGTFITTTEITRKMEMAAALTPPADVAVVDMETAAAARVAAEKGVPFMAIRAVSDGADEELGFSIGEIADSSLRVSILKVLGTVTRKPWIIPQMVRLARNSKQAGINLSDALHQLLTKL